MSLSLILYHITILPGHSANLATGEIHNDATGAVLRPVLVRSAHRYYLHVRVKRRSYRVHRLVMCAALGRELDRAEHVRHADGNALNNREANLSVGSAQDNARDKLLHNTNGRLLKNSDVREIRALFTRFGSRRLAARHGVTARHIAAIVAGRRWAGLPT